MLESRHQTRRTGRTLTAEMLTEESESLTEIEGRLLHWLLRYPLQRADDLVVGVARWASRATVYRHLHLLETRGLIESVLPKTPGDGKYLYHLSNLGLHVLATFLGRSAQELAQRWHADEAGLLRRLSRLPTQLLLQEVVNGLVTGAAEAMTSRGRRPQLVRWTWQRDATHRFQYREKKMRWFVDGAVALCIRTQQDNEGTLDKWFGLFLLFTDLDDERLMRLRLERLLCWRESPERWSTYRHMLPVLILARSLRQFDHWQRAGETATLKLRLDPLASALAYFPSSESGQVNPWQFTWRTLSTDTSCRLHNLLKPLPRAAFPPSLLEEEDREDARDARFPSKASVATVSAASGRPAHLPRLLVGDLAKRAAHLTQNGAEEQEVIALLGLRLTVCHWSILRLLLGHPLLSDEELAVLLNIQRKSVRCSLYELHRLGCLEPLPTRVGKRWHLRERGLDLLATTSHIDIRKIAVLSDEVANEETATVSVRGEAWLLKHIEHTAGIYGFFATLAQAARGEAGNALCWWETGAACEWRYRVGEQWYNFRPDALAEYRAGSQQFRFWLEWDRGAMNVRDLVVKFDAYAHYVASREWARESSSLPVLVSVAPDITQERRMQQVAQTRLTHLPGLVLWSTTEVLLNEYGPLAPVWLQRIPQRGQAAQLGNTLRQRLSDVISGKKPPAY